MDSELLRAPRNSKRWESLSKSLDFGGHFGKSSQEHVCSLSIPLLITVCLMFDFSLHVHFALSSHSSMV